MVSSVGHGHQHVSVIRTCLAQYIGQRGATLHGADVEAITEVAQALTVGVDHGDVVGFAGQMFGQRTADLTRAEDDDFHACNP